MERRANNDGRRVRFAPPPREHRAVREHNFGQLPPQERHIEPAFHFGQPPQEQSAAAEGLNFGGGNVPFGFGGGFGWGFNGFNPAQDANAQPANDRANVAAANVADGFVARPAQSEARQDPPPNAICRALQNVGIDYKAFKRASSNPGLTDADLLALPDMPWDWTAVSKHKVGMSETTLITLSDKDWDYKQLSRLCWSDDVIAALKDKDWDYSSTNLNYRGRSADLLMQTTTKTWNWFSQLSHLLPSADNREAVNQLLCKALVKSDEVVWDWHKPFENAKLADALLDIALTEIPKCPDEPWDYEKLSAAWWYPIDALLSLGVDKPWNMDAVSARADLTPDHVLRLYPDALWNYDITDKNPHAMKAARRRKDILKARDIILKVASYVPRGRLYLRQKKAFRARLLSQTSDSTRSPS